MLRRKIAVYILFVLLVALPVILLAQPTGGGPGGGGPPCGSPPCGPPPAVPITGLEILLIMGGAIGVRSVIRKNG